MKSEANVKKKEKKKLQESWMFAEKLMSPFIIAVLMGFPLINNPSRGEK